MPVYESIIKYIELLEASPWFGFVGFLLAIISIAATIVIYQKSKRVKIPCYSIRSTSLVRDLVSKIEPLKIFYSSEPIENLTVTKMMFWNAGQDTINKQDIASAEPITVQVKEGYKILNPPKIIQMKNPANQFSITSNQSFITLNFDYVDKDEGVIIEFFHTGKSSEDVQVRGKIKGVGELKYKDVPKTNEYLLSFFGLITAGLLSAFSAIFLDNFTSTNIIFIIIIIIIYLASVIFYVYKPHLKNKKPKTFIDFFTEEFTR
ncbi:MAG: hypothetical protein WC556_01590 [Candidatus Methanoperedens sp.]